MEPGARKAARDAELRPLMEDFGGWVYFVKSVFRV